MSRTAKGVHVEPLVPRPPFGALPQLTLLGSPCTASAGSLLLKPRPAALQSVAVLSWVEDRSAFPTTWSRGDSRLGRACLRQRIQDTSIFPLHDRLQGREQGFGLRIEPTVGGQQRELRVRNAF